MRMVLPTDPVRFLNGLGADVGTMMDQLLGESDHGSRTDWRFDVDIVESETGFHLIADLPGVRVEDVDIEIEKDRLVVSGKRTDCQRDDQHRHVRRERQFGDFRRVFTLPETIDRERVDANFENGVLTIDLHKSEVPAARKITIRTGSAGGHTVDAAAGGEASAAAGGQASASTDEESAG